MASAETQEELRDLPVGQFHGGDPDDLPVGQFHGGDPDDLPVGQFH
jgi:hypothetical protein